MNFKFMKVSLLAECVAWSINTQCHCDHDMCPRCLGKLKLQVRWWNFFVIWADIIMSPWLRYILENLGIVVGFLTGTKDFSFLQRIQTGSMAFWAWNSVGTCYFFLWGKPAWCDDPLHPSSVEVKNAWSCIPTVPCVFIVWYLTFKNHASYV
jgi:hypothetical protein